MASPSRRGRASQRRPQRLADSSFHRVTVLSPRKMVTRRIAARNNRSTFHRWTAGKMELEASGPRLATRTWNNHSWLVQGWSGSEKEKVLVPVGLLPSSRFWPTWLWSQISRPPMLCQAKNKPVTSAIKRVPANRTRDKPARVVVEEIPTGWGPAMDDSCKKAQIFFWTKLTSDNEKKIKKILWQSDWRNSGWIDKMSGNEFSFENVNSKTRRATL